MAARDEKNTRCLNAPLPSRLICSFLSQVRKRTWGKPSEAVLLSARRDARLRSLHLQYYTHISVRALSAAQNYFCVYVLEIFICHAERTPRRALYRSCTAELNLCISNPESHALSFFVLHYFCTHKLCFGGDDESGLWFFYYMGPPVWQLIAIICLTHAEISMRYALERLKGSLIFLPTALLRTMFIRQ